MRTRSSFLLFCTALLAGCGSITRAPSSPNDPPASPQPTALSISTSSLSNGTAGGAYTASITATGGKALYTYSATGLPSGLSIGASSGAISGTPGQNSVGTSVVSFSVSDASQPPQAIADEIVAQLLRG